MDVVDDGLQVIPLDQVSSLISDSLFPDSCLFIFSTLDRTSFRSSRIDTGVG